MPVLLVPKGRSGPREAVDMDLPEAIVPGRIFQTHRVGRETRRSPTARAAIEEEIREQATSIFQTRTVANVLRLAERRDAHPESDSRNTDHSRIQALQCPVLTYVGGVRKHRHRNTYSCVPRRRRT